VTKKDYELIARVLGESFAAADSRAGLRAQLLSRLSAALLEDNGRFDTPRFVTKVQDIENELRNCVDVALIRVPTQTRRG